MKKNTSLALLLLLTLAPAGVWAADAPKKDKGEVVVWGEMPAGAKTAYIGIHGGTVPVSLLSAGDGSPMIAVVGLTGNDFLNFMRTNGKLREEPVLPEFPAPQFSQEPMPKLAPVLSVLPVIAAIPYSSETHDQSGTVPLASPDPSTKNQTSPDTQNRQVPVEPAAPALSGTQPPEPAATPSPTPGVNATLLLAGTSDGDIPVIYATGRAFERMSLIPENWAPFGLTEKALSLEGEIKILAAPKKMPRNIKKSNKKP